MLRPQPLAAADAARWDQQVEEDCAELPHALHPREFGQHRIEGRAVPLYEFACATCDSKFERLMSFESATGAVNCPSCGSGESRRLISTFPALSR